MISLDTITYLEAILNKQIVTAGDPHFRDEVMLITKAQHELHNLRVALGGVSDTHPLEDHQPAPQKSVVPGSLPVNQ